MSILSGPRARIQAKYHLQSQDFSAVLRSIPAREEEWIELEGCYIGRITEKALQVHHDGELFWIPKHVIQDADQFSRWEEGCLLLVKEWFALKHRLI